MRCYVFTFQPGPKDIDMVYTLIDHKMMSKNVQNLSGTRRVISLPSFGHFMASSYGLNECKYMKPIF